MPNHNSELEMMHYKLPSGQLLEIDHEAQTKAPELLFEGLEPNSGVHNMIFDVLQECPLDGKNELLKNVILAGGSTCFPNFDDRLKYELAQLLNISKHQIEISPEQPSNPRKLKNWLGATIVAQLK